MVQRCAALVHEAPLISSMRHLVQRVQCDGTTARRTEDAKFLVEVVRNRKGSIRLVIENVRNQRLQQSLRMWT